MPRFPSNQRTGKEHVIMGGTKNLSNCRAGRFSESFREPLSLSLIRPRSENENSASSDDQKSTSQNATTDQASLELPDWAKEFLHDLSTNPDAVMKSSNQSLSSISLNACEAQGDISLARYEDDESETSVNRLSARLQKHTDAIVKKIQRDGGLTSGGLSSTGIVGCD